MAVDPYASEIELTGKCFGCGMVLGPDAGGQGVTHPVGQTKGFAGVRERLDGQDRAKGLFLDYGVVLPNAGDDGGFDEVAGFAPTLSAGHHRGMCGQVVELLGNGGEVIDVVHRSVEAIGIIG
ncbi:Uncharacterised protein [Mycobacteroides abscessus subsp. massiliense]|nr:Uncharacterised protein [Mycobacteroides abscessus subsp. massiliense]